MLKACTALVFCLGSAILLGQQPGTSPLLNVEHDLTSADLEAFFDGIIPLQLERSDTAGATVLVMKDGQTLLQKGYGFTDVKKSTPVDPGSTLFRLASISKLSTWISVMQLEEQGKLDIDADVNKYLDFEIHPAFDKPITLRNLMTHTGGFEEESKDIIITDLKYQISLRDFLIQNQPKRLFPPGTIPGYSNYGVGLASYVVQRVSGEPFEQYAERHIYQPLKMLHSTFYQPLPKGMSASEGYYSDTWKNAVGFEVFNPAGAGGFSSTAADMGRLGQALLNGGELDGVRILKAETLKAMWTPQFRASEGMPPLCMGFYERWRNNLRWIGHQGDLIAFHSAFYVEPAQKLVFFISYNSAGAGFKPRPEIINMFSDRYFPQYTKPASVKISIEEAKAIEGTYQTTRRADSTKLRIESLWSQTSATVNKDGELILDHSTDLRGHLIHWKPIGKDLWQNKDDQQRVQAIRDGSGKIVRFAGDFPGVQEERVPWYDNGKLVMSLLVLSLLILMAAVGALVGRVIGGFNRRKHAIEELTPGTLLLPWASKLSALLWVILVGAITIFSLSDGDEMLPPTPAWDLYFLMMNWYVGLLLLLSAIVVGSGIRVWRTDYKWTTKLKFTFMALACIYMSWFAIHFNLIGPVSRI